MARQNNLNRRTLLKGLGIGAISTTVGLPILCRAAMQNAVLGQATGVPFRQKGLDPYDRDKPRGHGQGQRPTGHHMYLQAMTQAGRAI
ncbi:MAG: hypothetical protein GY809_04445 [Planctomycetes bacterium]|nr:hypothetical protein [Planctomycetota bacterium]